MTEVRRRLGETLVEAGVITKEALDRALVIQQKQQLRLGTILLHEGFVTESQLVQALSLKLSIPWVSLWRLDIPDEVLDLVPANVAEEFFLIPIYIRTSQTGERALFVAMNDPTDEDALRFVSAHAGMPVKPMVAGPSDIASAIRVYYYGEEEAEPAPSNEAPVVPMASKATGEHAAPPPPPTQRPSAPRVKEPPAPPQPAGSAPSPGAEPREAPLDLIPTATMEGLGIVDEEDDDGPRESAGGPGPAATPGPEPEPEPATRPEAEAAVAPEPVTAAPEPDGGAGAEKGSVAPEEPPDEKTNPKVFADKTSAQREAERLIYGVGVAKAKRGISLTLLDGTTISFGPTKKKSGKGNGLSGKLTREDLIAGLKAAANGEPVEDFLPSDKWEAYVAALLQVLMNKHLVMFPELMAEIDAIIAKK